ncbi:MAG: hypothetical protein ABIB71_01325 [Candidatus Woesearchaeota archaeon]
MKDQKVTARILVEVIGGPKEYVEKTLGEVVKKLKAEKKIRILTEKSFEAKTISGEELEKLAASMQRKTDDVKAMENKLFSAFAEVELEVDKLKHLMDICFDYAPSTVEILEPAGMDIDCNDITEMLNDLLAKIHRYTYVIKAQQAQLLAVQEYLKQGDKK